MSVTYPVRLREWVRPAAIDTCPECRGHGYTTIEVREAVTVAAPEYPVTYPVTCYKTTRCWRCQGEGMLRRGE